MIPPSLIAIAMLCPLLAFGGGQRSYWKNEIVAVTWKIGSITGAATGNDDACGVVTCPRCQTLETRSFYDGKASSTSCLDLLFEFVSLSYSKFGTGSWRIF